MLVNKTQEDPPDAQHRPKHCKCGSLSTPECRMTLVWTLVYASRWKRSQVGPTHKLVLICPTNSIVWESKVIQNRAGGRKGEILP